MIGKSTRLEQGDCRRQKRPVGWRSGIIAAQGARVGDRSRRRQLRRCTGHKDLWLHARVGALPASCGRLFAAGRSHEEYLPGRAVESSRAAGKSATLPRSRIPQECILPVLAECLPDVVWCAPTPKDCRAYGRGQRILHNFYARPIDCASLARFARGRLTLEPVHFDRSCFYLMRSLR